MSHTCVVLFSALPASQLRQLTRWASTTHPTGHSVHVTKYVSVNVSSAQSAQSDACVAPGASVDEPSARHLLAAATFLSARRLALLADVLAD